MSEVARAVREVRERVAELARRHDRAPEDIALLAVSKTKPASMVRAAWQAGQHAFGENQLQDASAKLDALADLDLEWHFIGALQSNKTRPVAERFDWVHSVDRAKIARRLSAQRPADRPPLQVCIQVNTSGEASKAGVAPEAAAQLAHEIAGLPGLRLRGLMTIPAPAGDLDAQRVPFRRLAELRGALVAEGLELDTLSMGMSADMEAAIAEGATIVRIGTAIFGARGAGPTP